MDPSVGFGWGNRGYNWEYSATVQQQVFRNVALDVGYFHRSYGNFTVTDNLAVAATEEGAVRMKPQNLLINLPVHEA